MIVNFEEIKNKYYDYYLKIENYNLYYDITLTYQEVALIEEIKRIDHMNSNCAGLSEPIKEIDLDKICKNNDFNLSLWSHCIARFFNPIEINKPWNQVLVDKRINTPTIPKIKKQTFYPWEEKTIFSNIFDEYKMINDARYKEYRIRAKAKVPEYIVEGEVYEA